MAESRAAVLLASNGTTGVVAGRYESDTTADHGPCIDPEYMEGNQVDVTRLSNA